MKTRKTILIGILLAIAGYTKGQESSEEKASWVRDAESMRVAPSLSTRINSGQFIPAEDKVKEINTRRSGVNQIVPGKGLPTTGDPLMYKQKNDVRHKGVEPILTFDAVTANVSPTDPTGAVGPNHFVNAWNSSFRIWDKQGNPLTPAASLSNIWTGQSMGDPIVFYDQFADRFVITQFYRNGFLVAVGQGPDPVNDGWFTYQFPTNSFPDYPKYSIWSDGYYITANKDQSSPATRQVVFALERDAMIAGSANARIVGFNLPGIKVSGFYSPLAFSVSGFEMPPAGNAPIVYMQDDSWAGVSEDHLKIWNINVDWTTPANSTISASQQVSTAPFDGVFDGGSFVNLPQPSGGDIDALQAIVMYMAEYRRFPTHNSAIFNFVVDLNGNDNLAGIRWYELRQYTDGGEWQIFQEGTYAQPDGHSAFCGNMAMDAHGNIAMAYTVVSNTVYPGIRYTGRFDSDAPGLMTLAEQVIATGTSPNPSSRYGDYSQMTLDPTDDLTFWSIGEYFSGPGRKNKVGIFKLAANYANDIGVVNIVSPTTSSFGENIPVTIILRNYGTEAQQNITVGYRINNGKPYIETISQILNPSGTLQHTFSTTLDFLVEGDTALLEVFTISADDDNPVNDSMSISITPPFSFDLGIVNLLSPLSMTGLTSQESVSFLMENFSDIPVSNVDVTYILNNGEPVTETLFTPVEPQQVSHVTFNQTADFMTIGDHHIKIYINAPGDINPTNDTLETIITNIFCQPQSDCSTGYGINALVLKEVVNNSGCSTNGYSDFSHFVATLDRGTTSNLTITTGSGNVYLNLWIDFNDNFIFEPYEFIIRNRILGQGSTASEVSTTIPLIITNWASIGEHLMRAKTSNQQLSSSACEATEFGETEDYIVHIQNSTGIDNNPLLNSTLEVWDSGNNLFIAQLRSNHDQKVDITIHDTNGRLILFNRVLNYDGTYEYRFDMSYAPKGVYLVRMGNLDFGKVRKFIVK